MAVTLKADGWYIRFSLEDKSVPEQSVVEVEPTEANSIGVDAGLEYFAVRVSKPLRVLRIVIWKVCR